jgi:hypothetical protein
MERKVNKRTYGPAVLARHTHVQGGSRRQHADQKRRHEPAQQRPWCSGSRCCSSDWAPGRPGRCCWSACGGWTTGETRPLIGTGWAIHADFRPILRRLLCSHRPGTCGTGWTVGAERNVTRPGRIRTRTRNPNRGTTSAFGRCRALHAASLLPS